MEVYFFPFLFFRLFFFWRPPLDLDGGDGAPTATGSFFIDCSFLISSGFRIDRSLRNVSNLEANIAPSDAADDLPPAAPIPNRPSTNFSGSNYFQHAKEERKTLS